MKCAPIMLVAVSIGMLGLGTASRADDAPRALLGSRPAADGGAEAGAPIEPGVLRQRPVTIDAGTLQLLRAQPASPAQLPRLTIAAFEHNWELVLESTTVTGVGRRAWIGRIAGIPLSRATLVAGDGVLVATLRAGALGTYEIRPAADGVILLRELDAEQGIDCAGGQHTAPDDSSASAVRRPRGGPAALRGAEPLDEIRSHAEFADPEAGPPPQAVSGVGFRCDDGSRVDLLIAYTAQARAAAGGTAAIDALIDLSIVEANAAYVRSQIDLEVEVVHRVEVTYAETGTWTIDGPRLVNPADGFVDEVHPLRDQYGADCVSLWVNSLNAGGVGYFPDASQTGIGASGMGLLRLSSAGTLILAHELGHNLWCAHDRASNPDTPLLPYSYGFVEPGGQWQTIMAVSPTAYIDYFANPNVNWSGPNPPNPGPTGVADGNPNPCDVALTIQQTRHIVANFRPTATAGAGPVLYVRADAAPGGNGQSWATALNDLSDAICTAAGANGAVNSIWVKAGVYRPDGGSGDRAASFTLVDGVRIYGGFAGTETSLNQRNPVANVTRLSGDIGVPGVDADNSFHVVDGSAAGPTAVLDGVTISDGYADGADPHDGGGGLRVDGPGAPRLVNCIIEQNDAVYGGGVYCAWEAAPTLIGCTIRENASLGGAWPAGGGGVYCYSLAAPRFVGCVLRDNIAPRGAGVASFFESGPVFEDTLVELNDAGAGEGGGFYSYTDCVVELDGVRVRENSARYGAGMANFFGSNALLDEARFEENFGPPDAEGGAMYNYLSSPQIERSTFAGNSAAYGAGISNLFGAIPLIRNCAFLANAASADGGALYNYGDSAVLVEGCLFSGNTAAFGGAMIGLFNSDAILTNCTLAGNSATVAGGGVYNFDSDVTLANTLLWGNQVGVSTNQDAQLFLASGTATLRYCSVQGWTGGLGGVNNDGTNPQFIDANGGDNVYGTSDDDPRLAAGSPAINSGTNADVPVGLVYDLAGRPRIWSATVDRGAHERAPGLGDLDVDDDVDATDFAGLIECQRGPDLAPTPVPPPTVAECLAAFDLDQDGDVDEADAAAFQTFFDP